MANINEFRYTGIGSGFVAIPDLREIDRIERNPMAMSLTDPNQAGGAIPSYDFQLFQIPGFSELFANEFGASTRFNSNFPTPYTDFSLNQLLMALKVPNEIPFPQIQYPKDFEIGSFIPFFQNPSGRDNRPMQTPEEFEKAIRKLPRESGGISLRGALGLPPVSDDVQVLCNDCTAEQQAELAKTGTVTSKGGSGLFKIAGAQALKSFPKELIYLIAGVTIIILLVLFTRR